MDGRRQAPRLTPRVPRGDAARLGPQRVRLTQQRQARVVHPGQQPPAHASDVGPPQVMAFVGHGDDGMRVRAGQPPGLLSDQPALDLAPATLGTEPVPTGVVPDALTRPLGTALHMAPQHRRATGHECPHRLPHVARQRVTAFEGRGARLADRLHRHLGQRLDPQLRSPLPRGCGVVQRQLDCRMKTANTAARCRLTPHPQPPLSA